MGEPDMPSKINPRWGSNGSLSVDARKGVWVDWSGTEEERGGTLDLVMRELTCDKAGALKWLEEEHFIDERPLERREDGRARQEPEEPQPTEERYNSGDQGVKTEVEKYTYVNRDGEALYQVVRFQWKLPDGSWAIDPKTGTPRKTFAQRRRDARGEVVWNLEGVEHTIYRHNKVEQAIAEGKPIYLPEGEKDVKTFEQWDLVGSTNSGGAKNWTATLAAHFAGADVIIPIDNDDVGRARGQAIARSLRGIARRIRVLDFAQIIPDFPEKHDVTDWKDRGGTKEQLLEIVAKLPEWTPAPPPTKFGAKQLSSVGKNGIAYDWLIKGLIERAAVFMVAGEMQVGKSFMTIDMGMKVAQGVDYTDRKTKQGLVIYVACEDEKGVELRVEGYRREHGLGEDVPFLQMTRKLSLLDDKMIDEFIQECLAWEEYYGINLELIFIDTLAAATEGLDEINGAETGKVLGRLNRIVEKTGAAVGIVHHLNASGERVRGHSSLTANISQVIELRLMQEFQKDRRVPAKLILDDDNRPIRQAILVKNKNGTNQSKWRFVLRQIKLGDDSDGYPITTCVLVRPSGGKATVEDVSRLSADQKLVLKALEEAVEDQGMDMPIGVRVGPGARRCTTNQAWLDRVGKQWSFKAPEDKPEERNKELLDVVGRTSKSLINSGDIGRDNDRKIAWSYYRRDRPKTQPEAEPAKPPIDAEMKEAIASGALF